MRDRGYHWKRQHSGQPRVQRVGLSSSIRQGRPLAYRRWDCQQCDQESYSFAESVDVTGQQVDRQQLRHVGLSSERELAETIMVIQLSRCLAAAELLRKSGVSPWDCQAG